MYSLHLNRGLKTDVDYNVLEVLKEKNGFYKRKRTRQRQVRKGSRDSEQSLIPGSKRESPGKRKQFFPIGTQVLGGIP